MHKGRAGLPEHLCPREQSKLRWDWKGWAKQHGRAGLPEHRRAPEQRKLRWDWTGLCLECWRSVYWTKGLFCSNYTSNVGPWLPCFGVWCKGCYKSNNKRGYHVSATIYDKDSLEYDKVYNEAPLFADDLKTGDLDMPLDPHEFMRNHRGEHLVLPFECDLYIFRKVHKKALTCHWSWIM